MSKFIEEWNNWSKMDKFGFILHLSLLSSYLLLLIWAVYLSDNVISIFRITYVNQIVTWRNLLALIFITIGMTRFTDIFYKFTELFYPDTKDEREINKKKKILRKKYPSSIVFKKSRLLRIESEAKQLKAKINEWEKKYE